MALRVFIEKSLPEKISSDPTRIRQILFNLIGNAIKFTHQGSVTLTVGDDALIPSSNRPGDKMVIRFQVTDTGIGIRKEQQDILFQAFTQADASTTRIYGGTGLGLVLSKHLAQALGGDLILIDSAPGRGTTFAAKIDVKVPALENAESAPKQAELNAVTSAGDRRLDGLRILLAEDSPDNQLLMKRYLLREGAELVIASDGGETFKHAKSGDFDIVLMDIQMPVMDGYEVTRKLRAMGYEKPIIALTAHALSEEFERSIDAGCNDHLTKPVNRELLITTIKHFFPEASGLVGRA